MKIDSLPQVPHSQLQLNSFEWIQKSDEDRHVSFDKSREEEHKTHELINQIQSEVDLELEVMRLEKEAAQF